MHDDDTYLLPLAQDISTTNRGWVQLARPTDGVATNGKRKFELTSGDMTAYAASIRANAGRVSIDYDHSHSSGSGTRAAGWIDASTAEVRSGASGLELWAQVDWTPAAAAAIRSGEFRFISPELTFASSKDGVLRKAAKFLAAALTNRPFLDMEAVRLSLDEGDPMTDHNLALARRADERLLADGVLPAAASYEQLTHALDLAQAELGEYRPLTSVEIDDGVLRLRGDYCTRNYAERAEEPSTTAVSIQGTQVPVDPESVEQAQALTARLQQHGLSLETASPDQLRWIIEGSPL